MDYRRNVTKSKAGHYKLTLIDRATTWKVTSEYKWGSPEQAIREDEARLAEKLNGQIEAHRARLLRDIYA